MRRYALALLAATAVVLAAGDVRSAEGFNFEAIRGDPLDAKVGALVVPETQGRAWRRGPLAIFLWRSEAVNPKP